MISKDFFYDEVSRPITDQILRSVKSGLKHFEGDIFWPYDVPILEDLKYINWSYKIVRSSEVSKPDFWATAGVNESFEPSLEIAIVLKKGQHQKSVLIDRSELFGVVVHELHHIAQNVEKIGHFFARPKPSPGKLEYFTDPVEVEAFDLGFRAQSHMSNKSYRQIVREYLAQHRLSPEDINHIEKLWRNSTYPVFRKNMETA